MPQQNGYNGFVCILVVQVYVVNVKPVEHVERWKIQNLYTHSLVKQYY